jgi:hypothetical protein
MNYLGGSAGEMKRNENLKMRKTLIIAAAIGAVGPAMSADERSWDKWEQTTWSATCVSFSTGSGDLCTAGPLEVERTITQNDGSGQFFFSSGDDKNGVDAFFDNGPAAYGVPGIYPFKEVQIRGPSHDSRPTEMRGYCAFRGDVLSCASADRETKVVYRLVSKTRHVICPINNDGVSADMNRCVTN